MSEQSSTDLCLPVLTYRFPTFKVDYYGEGGTVTLFDDNTSSPVAVNKDHVHHAVRLGTTAALFCLSHELCHHLVGIYVMKQPWSPTIWRSAHQTLKASPKFSPEEWYVNAIQYHSMGKDPDDWGAFIDIQDKHKASPTSIMGLLMCLMTVASFPTIREVLIDTGIMPLVARYREAWLTELASQMQPFFRGFKLRPYRVTCGWPSRYGLGHKHIVVGECHSDDSSPDGIHEIFISPLLVKPIEVAGTLCHELAHVAAGVDAGHKGPFIRVCRHVGLTKGRPTQALPGPFLEGKVLRILERHGAYPHAGIIPVRKKVSKNESISLRCERCGCIIRISINWLDKAGFPKCGCGGSMSYTKEIGMS